MRHRLVLTTLVAALALGGTVSAQSPSPAPSGSTAGSPSPSGSPFPWPTLPAPEQIPLPAPFEPAGPATASITKDGIRVELWLSSLTVSPVEWVEAVVRTTNLADEPAWSLIGECGRTSTRVTADLRGAFSAGTSQPGSAGMFKRRAVDAAGVMRADFTSVPLGAAPTGIRAVALPECSGIQWPVQRLRPGGSITERFAWYPARTVGGSPERFAPLPPGPIRVPATWESMGHGLHRRRVWEDNRYAPIAVTATTQTAGADPGIPSIPQLVDTALADPSFAAWVDRDPDGQHGHVQVARWPDEEFRSAPTRWTGVGRYVDRGVVELSFTQPASDDGFTVGYADLDPWTGELLHVGFE